MPFSKKINPIIKPITLVNLGGGSEDHRVFQLSKKHPRKKFVSVDPNLSSHIQAVQNAKVQGVGRNAVFVRADSLGFLKKRRSQSIKIVNADFSTIDPVQAEKIGNFNKMPYSTDFFTEVKRVLTPHGRLYISVNIEDLQYLKAWLEKTGFKMTAKTIDILETSRRVSTTTAVIERYKQAGLLGSLIRVEAIPLR